MNRIAQFTSRRHRLVLLAIIAAGIVIRVLWMLPAQGLTRSTNESKNVATSLATHGTFADAYGVGTGPTAHVGMLTPLPAALVYKLFGAGTVLSEVILSIFAFGVIGLSIWLADRLLAHLGADSGARLLAAFFVSLVPIQVRLEVQELRHWEVTTAACLLLALLTMLVARPLSHSPATRLAGIGALAALLFVVSPPGGVAGVLAVALASVREVPFRRWPLASVGFLIVAGVLCGGWAVRNEQVMGKPIPLRSNFGLEFSLANDPAAVRWPKPSRDYVTRLRTIHPNARPKNLVRMRAAGGEVAYFAKLGEQAKAWALSHPLEFAWLCVRHVTTFFLPPAWFWEIQWTATARTGRGAAFRSATLSALTVIALLTLAWQARRDRRYAYVLVAVLACALPYVVVQPLLRYRYLTSTLLVFVAFDGMTRAIGARRQRRAAILPG